MRLRTLFALSVTVLLAFTAGTIGWLGYSNSNLEIKRFTQQQFATANALATHHVLNFLDEPADRLLSELTLRARRGMLNLNDDRTFGLDLAERLRVNPLLAWIEYSDATTGHFVGARRADDGAIVINISTPGQGPSREEKVDVDGRMTPYSHLSSGRYDARQRDWFRQAVAAPGTVWSPAYTFYDGAQGITASRAWRVTDDAAPAGVFGVDFFLKNLQDMLDSPIGKFHRFSAILATDGTLICSSRDPDAPALVAALAAWIRANPQFKNIDGKDTSHLVPIEVGPTAYLAAFVHVDAPSGLQCVVASTAPRDVLFHDRDAVAHRIIQVALAALAVGVLAGILMGHRISEPLRLLGNDLASVGQFELARGTRPHSVVSEVNQLNDAADRMKSGLRSFVKYVPDDLVRQLLSTGHEAALGGEVRRLTVFFSDIENFTTYSETVPPDRLVHELSEYLDILTHQLRLHTGTIDKFLGDGLMAFFNAPIAVPLHEQEACRAALAALAKLDTWRADKPGAPFGTRVGLHAGEVLVGNIGTAERFAYTVLGDVVNVSSRLEGLNKIYGTQILASGEVHSYTSTNFEWRRLDRAVVAGRKGSLELFELLGAKGTVDAGRLRRRDLYETALGLYFERAFAEAQALFGKVATEWPDDKAAWLMILRCDTFISQPPEADWDGAFTHELK